jgi:hypothetical protein
MPICGAACPPRQAARNRTMGFLGALLAVVALTSCSTPSGRAGSRPARWSPSRAVLVRTTPPAMNSRCSAIRFELHDGIRVPAPYLAAIDFVSPSTGIGITSSSIPCSLGPGGGSTEPFPVVLVVSTDGGISWRTVGSPLPESRAEAASTVLVFASRTTGFVELGGHLDHTSDGGRHWHRLRLGGAVVGLEPSRLGVVALVVDSSRRAAAAVLLSDKAASVLRMTSSVRGSWNRATSSKEMAVLSGGDILLAVPGKRSWSLFRSLGFFGRWRPVANPCPGWPIDSIVPDGTHGVVAACNRGIGMFKSLKLIALSSDGGASWKTVAALRHLGTDVSGLPVTDLLSLAVSPRGRLYMAASVELAMSSDDGHHWAPLMVARHLAGLPGNGSLAADFSFVGRSGGWLLLPGEALLRTVNGRYWYELADANQ